MQAYLNIINDILENGEIVKNRTGIDTKMIVGTHFKHDMRTGFPLLTTKKVNPHTVFVELEGFIKGITDKKWFQERKCFIWDEWCNPECLKKYNSMNPYGLLVKLINQNLSYPSLSPKMNPLLDSLNNELNRNLSFNDVKKAIQMYETDLGPIYGYQWRHFGKQYFENNKTSVILNKNCGSFIVNVETTDGVDQLQQLVNTMKTNPTDRRMIVTAWNPQEIVNDTMALPPCHWAFEVHSNGKEFDLIWHQRSVDVFLGLPFNIASYGMLMKLLEAETGLTARYLNGFLGNTHIYVNHMQQVNILLQHTPLKLPTLTIPDGIGLFNWTADDYILDNYVNYGFLKASVAV